MLKTTKEINCNFYKTRLARKSNNLRRYLGYKYEHYIEHFLNAEKVLNFIFFHNRKNLKIELEDVLDQYYDYCYAMTLLIYDGQEVEILPGINAKLIYKKSNIATINNEEVKCPIYLKIYGPAIGDDYYDIARKTTKHRIQNAINNNSIIATYGNSTKKNID